MKFRDALVKKLKGKKDGQPEPSAPSAPPADEEVSFRIPFAELRFFLFSDPKSGDLRCKPYRGGLRCGTCDRRRAGPCIRELGIRFKMHRFLSPRRQLPIASFLFRNSINNSLVFLSISQDLFNISSVFPKFSLRFL